MESNFKRRSFGRTEYENLPSYGILTQREVGDVHCCIIPNHLHHDADVVFDSTVPVKSWFTGVQREGRVVPILCDMGPDRFDAQWKAESEERDDSSESEESADSASE